MVRGGKRDGGGGGECPTACHVRCVTLVVVTAKVSLPLAQFFFISGRHRTKSFTITVIIQGDAKNQHKKVFKILTYCVKTTSIYSKKKNVNNSQSEKYNFLNNLIFLVFLK